MHRPASRVDYFVIETLSSSLVLLNVWVCFYLNMSGMVHTGGESPQDGLRDVWTHGTILASAYVLCHLSTMWL